MSVLLEFAMFPTDKEESVSKYVSRIVEMIRDSGYNYKLTAMGTIVETDTLPQALEIINKAYQELENDCNRVYSNLKFDIRKDRSNCLENKIKSIENVIGSVKS